MGKQWAAILACGALLAGACGASSSDSKAEPPAHPGVVPSTPAPRALPTTTTTVPDYSFDDSVPPPKLLNTGTNFVEILKSLSAYGNWLAAHHPDPALVANIVAPGTRQRALFSRDLQRLRDNSRRAVEVLGEPSKYSIISARSDAFSARVVEDIRFHRAVDETGRVTSEVKYTAPTTYLMLVVRDSGRWQFAAVDEQTPESAS